jgi:riboflavin kinase/FMN adenylyltransferase
MVNIGIRPTFDSGQRTVEAHLLDFDGDLYGMLLTLHFIARLRDEQRFDDVDALVAQMRRDEAEARRLLLPS